MEGALIARSYNNNGRNKNKKNTQAFQPCPYYEKSNHPQNKCWWIPDAKCGQCDQLGHINKICNSQQQGEAKTALGQIEEE